MNNRQKYTEEHTDIVDKIFNTAKGVSLSASEKIRMRQKIQMAIGAPIPTPYHFGYKTYTAIVAVLIFMLAGGTSFAARLAVPGDILYPIKINVNEAAESFFSVGTKSAATTQAVHALARLQEVEQLAISNKLTPVAQAEAKTQFTEDANSVVASVQQLTAEGDAQAAVQVSADFENSLQNQKDILTTLSAQASDQGDAQPLVKASIQSASQLSAQSTNLTISPTSQSALLSDLANTVTAHLQVAAQVTADIEASVATSTDITLTATSTPMSTGDNTGTTTETSSLPGGDVTGITGTSTPSGTATSTTATSTTLNLKLKTTLKKAIH